jgi:tetratricopeptide (TPR) repeat protein
VDVSTAESLLTFAEQAGAGLRGLDSKAAFQRLADRYSDLLSAMQCFIEHACPTEACGLASALAPFWMATRRMDEGAAWLDRVLALSGGEDAKRGRALFDAGYLAFWRGEDERSASLQNQALDLGRRTNNPTVAALALVGLARIALRTNVDEARRLCREALAVTEGTADQAGRSSAMHVLAVASQMAGDLAEARELMSRRIALAREAGNFAVISSEAGNLSMVERQFGNLDAAEALAREALMIDWRRGDEMALPWKVNGLAAVAADRRDFVRAARLIGIADVTLEAAGGAWPPDERQHYERTVATLIREIGAAGFDRMRSEGRSMTTTDAIEFALGTGPVGQPGQC